MRNSNTFLKLAGDLENWNKKLISGAVKIFELIEQVKNNPSQKDFVKKLSESFGPHNKKAYELITQLEQAVFDLRNQNKSALADILEKKANELSKNYHQCFEPAIFAFRGVDGVDISELPVPQYFNDYVMKVYFIANDIVKLLKRIDKALTLLLKDNAKQPKEASGDEGKLQQETPETNTALIYQSDASEFYNIPKSTLSKAAKKKPGEVGYMWSGHKGKRVFYRKSDCAKISRSRAKLSG